MSLSINKLEKLLLSRQLSAKRYFVIKKMCVYIEVTNSVYADTFMLYIPSKYEIKIDGGNNVYKLDIIELAEDGNIADEYSNEQNPIDLEKIYGELDLDENKKINTDMKSHLESNYKRPLDLKDIPMDVENIKKIFRQLNRLKFSVQNIKYKLCILFKEYICCIRRDDSLIGYIIRKFNGTEQQKLYVSIDLETLYEKIDVLNYDIKTINTGIYRILERNQDKHQINIKKIIEEKDKNITLFSSSILGKKQKLISYMEHLDSLLENTNKAEKACLEELKNIKELYTTNLEITRQTTKIRSKLDDIISVRERIVNSICTTKAQYENLILKADNICFDNIIMIDAITKNFIALTQI